jgi:hypothetical protein
VKEVMNRSNSKLVLGATALLLLSGLVGCDNSDDSGMVGGHSYPPVGSDVTVQYRRDYLGISGEAKVGVMGEAASQPVASGGTLKRMNDEFLVLGVNNDPNRELWIPRSSILLLDVRKTR